MIPVSLTIKGLYSYQEEQEIDFGKLTAGQLFGIFGPVGSGKSTILEAISFALYGETERLNLHENRSYNMMNLKSDELLIDFTFRNYDQQEYRYMVRGKRNGKDFDNVGAFMRSAYIKEKENWRPLASASAENVIGLSYDNFRRTIIIPQGKFQEFLQLTDKHRTNMLKEIFQLDKFEFFYQTASLERMNNEAMQNLSGRLSHFDPITKEIIAEKEIKVAELFGSLEKQRIALQQKDTELKELEDQKKLFGDLESSRINLRNLLTDENLYEQHSKKINDYEYCLRHFKDSLNRKDDYGKAISQVKLKISELKTDYDNCCLELAVMEEKSVTVKEAFLKQDEHKEILNDYHLLINLVKLKSKTDQLKPRINSGQAHVDTALADKNNAEKKVEEIKGKLREQRTALPDVGTLAAMRAWFVKNENLGQNILKLRLELREQNESLEAVSKEMQEHLTNPLLENVEKGIPPHYYSEQVLELRNAVKAKQEELLSDVEHYNLQVKLGEFSSELQKDEPCMLCGSIHHPNILKVEDVKGNLLAVRKRIESNKDLDKFYEGILNNLTGFINREKHHIQQAELLQKKLNAELFAEKEHVQIFNWTGFTINDREKVEEKFKMAEQMQKAIKILDANLEKEEKVLKVANDDHNKFSKAIEGFKSDLIGKESEALTLKKQLKKLVLEDYSHLQEEELKLKANQLSQGIIRVKEQFEQLTGQIEQQRLLRGSLEERIKSAEEILVAEEEKLRKVEENLNQELEKSPYKDCAEVALVLENTFDLNKLKELVAHYQKQVFSGRQLINQMEKQCEGKSFELSVYNLLLESIVPLKEILDLQNTEYIKEKSILDQFKKDFEEKLLLVIQLGKLQHRASNLNTLKQLFKGSGFVGYVSSVYLQNLCQAANERFYKLTRQQLRLEVTDKNDFLVRDFLNNGKVRSVKTLSGGQTFQASLSLALALAESVQQQNKAQQNFFFLDEGFGSLDKESLQVAFETLKSLRKENRIVGIISHVEELQQEIDVYLNVLNDPFLGSKIKGNWE